MNYKEKIMNHKERCDRLEAMVDRMSETIVGMYEETFYSTLDRDLTIASLRAELKSSTLLAEAYRKENKELLDKIVIYEKVAVCAKRLAVRDYAATREPSEILYELMSSLEELDRLTK